RQQLEHGIFRLHQSAQKTGLGAIFVDVEGVDLGKEGESVRREVNKLMRGTRPAAQHGPRASLMQIASVTGEVILIDLMAFRNDPQGNPRGRAGTFTPQGGINTKREKAVTGPSHGGRPLGAMAEDSYPGLGFELPYVLEQLLGGYLLVFFGGESDLLMLKALYGAPRIDDLEWRTADVQSWISENSGTGGRVAGSRDKIGLAKAWVECCGDERFRVDKDMAERILVAGDYRIKGVVYSAAPREPQTSDSAKVATAYMIRDVTNLCYLSFYCLFSFHCSSMSAGLIQLHQALLRYTMERRQVYMQAGGKQGLESARVLERLTRQYDSEGRAWGHITEELGDLKRSVYGVASSRWKNIIKGDLVTRGWAALAAPKASTIMTLIFKHVRSPADRASSPASRTAF
ncbi:MAG: hypothetical protein GY739_12575, partial [Mesoflavibacter sp.]|nr:hypothetical protein [Mesoflavibacter sp.]